MKVDTNAPAMFEGERINVTEDRSVLHTALRLPRDTHLVVDGQDVADDVHEVLDRMAEFAVRVRTGEWLGFTGKRIRNVVNSCFGGKRIVIFSGGEPKTDAELLDEVRGIAAGGGFGSIMGRNAFQRPKAEGVKILKEVMGIFKDSSAK